MPTIVNTDASGNYLVSVISGSVNVVVDQADSDIPAGSSVTTNTNGGTTAQTVIATPNTITNTKNVGFAQTTGVSGHIFYDTNHDGIQQTGEINLPNITVSIKDSTGQTQYVNTDTNGNYTAFVAAGSVTTIMNINDPDVPTGSQVTTNTNGGTISQTLTAVVNTTTPAKPIGLDILMTQVSGHVFIDSNNDGIQQSTEPNAVGVPIKITDSLATVQTVYTDGNGNYIANVVPGTVTADINQTSAAIPTGSTLSTGSQPLGTDPNTITAVVGAITPIQNVGYYQPKGTVTGHIFSDVNNDGIQQAGEPNLPNISVVITDSLGHVQTVSTDATGNYSAQVVSGSTTATVNIGDPDIVAGSVISTTTQPLGTASNTVTVVAGGTISATNVGFWKNPLVTTVTTVSGHIFVDSNNNAAQNGTEPNLAGIPVKITDSLGGIQTVYTDSNGNYAAVVTPGVVTVDVDQSSSVIPVGSIISTNPSGGTDTQIITAVIGINTPVKNVGFAQTTTISGHLFYDSNNNGTQDSGEPNLPNVDVVITDSLGNTQVVSTDVSGNYIANVSSGNVTAVVNSTDVNLPVGSVVTTNTSGGTLSQTISAILGSNTPDKNVGFFRPNATATTISGHLFNDLNGDGIQQSGESNLVGVDVLITDSSGAPFTVSTDTNGNYQAVVQPGSVTASVVLTDSDIPQGATVSTGSNPLGSSASTVIAVTNTNVPIHNVGFNQKTGYISGHVFYDSNNDGVQQIAEPNIASVTVTITDANGINHVVTTDINGNYELLVPAGITKTSVNSADPHISPIGSGVSTSSNGGTANQTTTVLPSPFTSTITNPKVITPTKNVGFYKAVVNLTTISGHIWSDLNGDGTQQPNEPNLPNISVVITDSAGQVQTVETDENGNYRAIVPPGSTTVNIDENDTDIPPFTKISTDSLGGSDTQTLVVVAGTDNLVKNVGYFGFDPEIRLSKSVDKDNVKPGDVLIYTIDYENVGIGDAIGGLFIEQLPKYTLFVAEKSDAGWSCVTNPNGSQTCTIAITRINSKQKGQFKIAVRVLEVPDDIGELANNVSLSINDGRGKKLTSAATKNVTVIPTLKSMLIRTGGFINSQINNPENNDTLMSLGIVMLLAGLALFTGYYVRKLVEDVLI